MDMSQYRDLFISESREHLRSLSDLIVALEKDACDKDTINSLFRTAHSIKGMAASMGYGAIADLAHKMEDLMDRVRKGTLVYDTGAADLLLEGTDFLEVMINDVECEAAGECDISGLVERIAGYSSKEALATVSRPGKAEATGPEKISLLYQAESPHAMREGETQQTVRVRTSVLDSLINTTGELITNKHRLMNIGREAGSERLDGAIGELTRLLRELHNEVMSVRMMPFATITDRFPRLIRDLAKKSGKEVVFEIAGSEIELDRGIIEGLSDPLIHILRNAVDHGLEPAPERLAVGKAPTGKIRLTTCREKDRVIIVIEDDGRGMDPATLIAHATAKGLIKPEEGWMMSPQDAFMLTCIPGFSTAGEVTDVSGRGVGMDAVRSAVQSLGGSLAIESEVGKGSRIILSLPLTIAIINVLLAAAATLTIAVPVTNILRTVELRRSVISSQGKQKVFHMGEEAVPLLSLNRIFGLPLTRLTGDVIPVFVTEMKGRKVGLVVDRFLGQQEVFIKPLGRPLAKLKGLAGGAILGDGESVFILDMANLV
ncbi:MAG: two-component system chemotaxis family sensor kinase [Geobacteraceae bacterium]|nr:MAG: two-component system chemotaxis family sensor kinase [Geobacteraceae bacterium]